MRRSPSIPEGEVRRMRIDGPSLAGNMLGDPTRRDVAVWVPHGHDGAGLPLLVALAGFLGSGVGLAGWRGFGENLPERLDRLVHEGALPPCAVAMPDGFTRLGGNQYVDSPVTGAWTRFLADDLVPALETALGCGGPGRRGLFGKSSGGYGALANAMLRPDVWSAAACHSGDMGFEWVYLPDMPGVLRTLARHEGSIERFVAHVEASAATRVDGGDTHALMILAMAATYDPDPAAYLGIRLPVTADTCEVVPERWERWLDADPIRMAPRHAGALKALKALFIDCGDRDRYNLLYGARRLARALDAAGVPHRYEEFPGDHSGIDHRQDVSLPLLALALSA
jgi:enterochelin esterase-like enzyme